MSRAQFSRYLSVALAVTFAVAATTYFLIEFILFNQ